MYDIIVETLTGSEFEVTVTDKDTVGYIKSRIQKYEGIPIGQQHLLYNHQELTDNMEMKEIGLESGSRLKLVIDMKGGPVSARRIVSSLPEYDNWLDFSDVLNTSRNEHLTISTQQVRLLVYKDCKKSNNYRLMKLIADRKSNISSKSLDDDSSNNVPDQWVKENLQTLEKMHQLRLQLDQKRKGKNIRDTFDNQNSNPNKSLHNDDESEILRYKHFEGLSKKLQPGQRVIAPPKSNNQTGTKSKIFSTERIANCDYSLQGRKSSCGLLNKYGLNKTCIRPPSLIPIQSNKNENIFPIPNSSTYSLPRPPPLSNSFPKLVDIDLPNRNPPIGPPSIFKFPKNPLDSNIEPTNICSEELRSQLRENIKRNRSFKTIETEKYQLEETLKRPLSTNRSISSFIDKLFSAPPTENFERHTNSKSVQDIMETFALNSTEIVNDFNKITKEDEREYLLSKRSNCFGHSVSTSSGTIENNFFPDRKTSLGLNSIENVRCGSDLKMEASGAASSALDGSLRLYKMASEGNTDYELPKLLIREDSPVESFHSSDPQLETLTLRGESPKTNLETYAKLTNTTGTSANTATTATASIPELNDGGSSSEINPNTNILKSPWSHHHSDLGLNHLELNFLKHNFTDDIDYSKRTSPSCNNDSVLKIASNLEINNAWNNTSELDGQSQPSTTSLNFINGDLTSSDDEDLFNTSCCMLHSNSKSKSIELNEFRMMFGSSPTLLNSNYNNINHHASRLDAIPIQYRRGYTNLNDACLSSSTSDLELFNGVRKKNSSKSASQELPSSFSRHRTNNNNNSLDFIRSYENLDRMKILRMKNQRGRNTTANTTGESISNRRFWDNINGTNDGSNGLNNKKRNHSLQNNFSRERLQEEELCDDDFSYSNLGYENAINASAAGSNCSSTATSECRLPIDFPSDENLFNMNLDRLTGDFNLLSTTSLTDCISVSTSNSKNTSRSNDLLTTRLDIDDYNYNEDDCNINTIKKSPRSKKTKDTDKNNDNEIKNTSTIKKSEKQRCAKCNKKLGLIMIMKCHCQKVFCPQHRYAEAHNCSYNFKREGKKIIEKENPLVIAQKVAKI